MPPRKPLTVLLACVALALTACGGDDSDEYAGELDAALETIANLGESSAPLANPESVDQYVAGVREIIGQIEGAIAELDGIEPPDEVAAVHNELIFALEGYGAAFPPLADAAAAGDEEALRASATELQSAARDFQEEAAELDRRFQEEGVDVTLLAG